MRLFARIVPPLSVVSLMQKDVIAGGEEHTVPAPARSVAAEAFATGRLAGPLIVGQLSQIGLAFTDTIMAGRLGPTDLAAVSVGSSLWMPVNLAVIGVLLALSPTVAQLYGAGRRGEIGVWFRQGIWLALALSLLAVPIVRSIDGVMLWLQIDPSIIPVTSDYLAAVSFGVPAACLLLVPRFVSEGIGHTRPIMFAQLGALGLNVIFNYAFMFGKFGMPAMGAVGAGWSTALVLWANALFMFAYVALHRRFRPLQLFARWAWPAYHEFSRLVRLGFPMAMTLVLEMGLFSAVTLLMGTLGAATVAAHQIALNYAGLVFMVPLGLSMAITIRVGQETGAGRPQAARFAGMVGMGMAAVFMGISAMVMFAVPDAIVAIYTDDAIVSRLAIELLFFAAVFQIADGLQVSALGGLRGLKDTVWPMAITFVVYWLVAFPLAWWFGFTQAFGAPGLWVGMVAGLSLAAVLLAWRFHSLSKNN